MERLEWQSVQSHVSKLELNGKALQRRNSSVSGAVVFNNERIREPELPVLGILVFSERLERSPKDAILTIQDWSPVTVVGADRALECG